MIIRLLVQTTNSTVISLVIYTPELLTPPNCGQNFRGCPVFRGFIVHNRNHYQLASNFAHIVLETRGVFIVSFYKLYRLL